MHPASATLDVKSGGLSFIPEGLSAAARSTLDVKSAIDAAPPSAMPHAIPAAAKVATIATTWAAVRQTRRPRLNARSASSDPGSGVEWAHARTHGAASTASALIRSAGSVRSIARIRSFASSETARHCRGYPVKPTASKPSLIAARVDGRSESDFGSNGLYAPSRMKRITPSDHVSTSTPYGPSARISGAM